MDMDFRVKAIALFVSVALVFLSIRYAFQNDQVFNMEIKEKDLYSVVFDAGSTGSRMFVFHFRVNHGGASNREQVLLVNEVFEHVEPGISSYSHNPSQAATSLAPMLEKAVASVPASQQSLTLITLKATAGLRLLPKEKGDRIMEEVTSLIQSSPFLLPDPSKIEVMGGAEEGLFGWVTVNFLLDVLWDNVADNTVATIDLGGGSMQVTFELSDHADLSDVRVRELYKLRLLQEYFLVFTYSYLGSGIMSGRLGIMGVVEGDLVKPSKDERPVLSAPLQSPCFASDFNMSWKHGENDYIIQGTSSSPSKLQACQHQVEQFIPKANHIKNKQLHQKELHLFSYFYDVARWAKLVDKSDDHKTLTPDHFLKSAEFYCMTDHFLPKRPFLCMDLLYVHTLLTGGFGFSADQKLHVEKRINSYEASWTLGAALSTLSSQFSYSTIHL